MPYSLRSSAERLPNRSKVQRNTTKEVRWRIGHSHRTCGLYKPTTEQWPAAMICLMVGCACSQSSGIPVQVASGMKVLENAGLIPPLLEEATCVAFDSLASRKHDTILRCVDVWRMTFAYTTSNFIALLVPPCHPPQPYQEMGTEILL